MEYLLNIWAIIVAALVQYILGALWFSPLLFGNIWAKASGFTKKDMEKAMKKGMTKNYIMQFVGSLVMCFVLAQFVNYAGATTAWLGVQAGFWIWLGFIVPATMGSVLWENKSKTAFAINAIYYLVALVITGSILAVWI